ncbi:ABC transporter ATP-binding protein [Gordonia sp. ABSL11-1]|uniref:ABC transporter ATP-binding protein n=1 Tax=Gordonia sp. ABSL11-1 TaxID=3053924 RepID=UPI002573A5B5|nr:ABC transporter ATP-binding protein [Gordonia sp. ABSL11-1]MDL9949018.1 ABC transporter ATP-binding protein [Gordonia sp. ABSL11-1]
MNFPRNASIPKLQRDIMSQGLRESKWTVTAFIALTAFASGCTVAAPLLIAHVVQSQTITTTDLLVSFGLVAAVLAVARFLQDVRMVLMNRVQQRVANYANSEVMRRLLDSDPSLITDNNPARIANTIQTFNQSNKMYIQMFLMVFISCVFDVIFSFLVIGSYVNWTIGVAVLLYGILTTWLTLRANKVTNIFLKTAQSRSNESANLTGNVVSNMLALKVFRGSQWVTELNNRYFRESRQGWNDFYTKRIRFGALQAALLFTQYLVVFGILALQSGTGREQLGAVVVLVLILAQLNRPFEMIATSLRDFTIAKSMADPLQDTLDTYIGPPLPAQTRSPALSSTDPSIVIHDLSYRHTPNAEPVLDKLAHEFRPGAINFITGASGAGKSTLMRILLGVHRDYTGSVRINGTELTSIHPETYWEDIGYVPQDPMLMNASIRDNILLGRAHTDAEVLHALDTVELSTKLHTIDDGLNFTVGERGERLSGGERQRIAIARALLAHPTILFLDEPSAALDATTEANIFHRLREQMHDTTIIAITHRHTVIHTTDTVLDLSNESVQLG